MFNSQSDPKGNHKTLIPLIDDIKSEIRYEDGTGYLRTSTKRLSANVSQKTGGKKSARSKAVSKSAKSSMCELLTLQKPSEALIILDLNRKMNTMCIESQSLGEMSLKKVQGSI